MKSKVYYDSDYDNLMISEKAENENVKRNFMFDDIVISLTGNGKIVAIEIRGISNYLKEIGFDPKILENIEDAQLVIKPKKDFIFIGFQIIGKTSEQQRIPVANIPLSCINQTI